MTSHRAEFAGALLLDLIGAAGALLTAGRTWQTVVTPRPHPLADDVLQLSGRTIDTADTALALVALAGAVAVLATRGRARQLIGLVLALAGAAIVWRSLTGLNAISAARARSLVQTKHSGVGVDATVVPQVSVHSGWPTLAVVCGALVLLGGALIAARGHRWAGMSRRYEAPASAGDLADKTARTRASASLWTALDRGEDPTGGDESRGAGTGG